MLHVLLSWAPGCFGLAVKREAFLLTKRMYTSTTAVVVLRYVCLVRTFALSGWMNVLGLVPSFAVSFLGRTTAA